MSNTAITKLTAILLAIIVIVASAGAYYSYSALQPKTQQVNIILCEPLTGSMASIGAQSRDGAILAGDEINDAGGIKSLGGAKMNLIIVDNKGDTSVAASEIQRVIGSNKITAIVGSYGSALSIAISEVGERAKIPTVTVAGADNIFDRGFKYIFNDAPKSRFYGVAEVDYMLQLSKSLGFPLTKIAVVHEDGPFGTSVSNGANERAKSKGLEVVLDEAYRAAALTDATPIALKIKISGAQAVLLGPYLTDGSVLLKAMASQGLKLPTIGAGGVVDMTFRNVTGPAADYAFGVTPYNWDMKSPLTQSIAQKYNSRFGRRMFDASGTTYGATYIVKEALEKAASDDPQKVREAIAGMDITGGQIGAVIPGNRLKIASDGSLATVYDGSGSGYLLLIQWGKNGELRIVSPESEATAKPVWPPPS